MIIRSHDYLTVFEIFQTSFFIGGKYHYQKTRIWVNGFWNKTIILFIFTTSFSGNFCKCLLFISYYQIIFHCLRFFLPFICLTHSCCMPQLVFFCIFCLIENKKFCQNATNCDSFNFLFIFENFEFFECSRYKNNFFSSAFEGLDRFRPKENSNT